MSEAERPSWMDSSNPKISQGSRQQRQSYIKTDLPAPQQAKQTRNPTDPSLLAGVLISAWILMLSFWFSAVVGLLSALFPPNSKTIEAGFSSISVIDTSDYFSFGRVLVGLGLALALSVGTWVVVRGSIEQ